MAVATEGDAIEPKGGLLTNPPFRVKNLALIPTWECDVACHHCVFESSPKVKGRLPIEVALSLIGELRELSTLNVVTVSGGEPLLDPDYLLAVAIACARVQLPFRIATNGTFATSVETAIKILTPFVEIGVESIGLSWDRYHSQFITPDRIVNAIRACRKLGISVQLTSVVSKDSRLSDALESLGEDAYELRSVQVKCLPIGRAAKKIDPKNYLKAAEWEVARACRSDFDTLAIVHDGTVYPCCAVGGFTGGIALGNYPNEGVEALLKRRDEGFKWVALAANGPHYFLQYASKAEYVAMGAKADLHDCVNCNRMFASPIGDKLVQRAEQKVSAQVQDLIKGMEW